MTQMERRRLRLLQGVSLGSFPSGHHFRDEFFGNHDWYCFRLTLCRFDHSFVSLTLSGYRLAPRRSVTVFPRGPHFCRASE
jgi:hypothetical protein